MHLRPFVVAIEEERLAPPLGVETSLDLPWCAHGFVVLSVNVSVLL